jgi:hypothetical protein
LLTCSPSHRSPVLLLSLDIAEGSTLLTSGIFRWTVTHWLSVVCRPSLVFKTGNHVAAILLSTSVTPGHSCFEHGPTTNAHEHRLCRIQGPTESICVSALRVRRRHKGGQSFDRFCPVSTL